MSSPLNNRFEQAYAEFEEQKNAIAEFERRLAEKASTLTAKNRAVSVTVDGQGDVVEISFPTGAYRKMAPAELGALLVETIDAARTQARAGTTELLDSFLPGGMPAFDLLNSSVEFDEIMSQAMRAADRMFSNLPSNSARREES
ncbi:YbaB/EbfC family nucleoid-associated protein [Micromonospora sp. NPDC049366]|uniref:YbaB/EbfC family nucleoid-associated protein n=1 Tax=Micromonospora sp. NPDC049366 TaxID=3364271 RepID=UPI00378B559D